MQQIRSQLIGMVTSFTNDIANDQTRNDIATISGFSYQKDVIRKSLQDALTANGYNAD
jgi:hypothetical protein